jgi:lipopolysaccharide biosynthesis glycosyltransferase
MILTAVDDNFLCEAIFLIKSCARHAPEQRFYLFLVNSSEQRVAELRACHPNIIIEHVQWPYDAKRWRGLMCCARSIPILNVLETYKEPVLCLDSDTLIMARLDGLFGELKTFDLLVRYHPESEVQGAGGTKNAAKFNSGVIAIRPSDVGIQFAREYDRRIREWINSGKEICKTDESYKINTCIDQEFLYVIYKEFEGRIKFKPLPDKFNDAKFKPDSVIWHGKGTARKKPHYVRAKLAYGNRLSYYAYSVVCYWPLRFVYYMGYLVRTWRNAS